MHTTMAAGSTGTSHGWDVEGTNLQTRALKTVAGLLQHYPHIQHHGVGFTDASWKKILVGHRRETLFYFNSPGLQKEK